MLREREGLMVKSIPQLSLEVVYPPFSSKLNLNTCGDPDCRNFGVAPDFSLPTFKGRGSQQRKMEASVSIPALTSGSGSYILNSDDKKQRVSTVFEYEGDPHGWDDGRVMACRHQKRNGSCDISFKVLSNNHFEEELNRLRLQNDLLMGPVCGNCGQRYLDAPEEFIFNGTHGKLKPGKNGRKSKPAGFRIIHKPCQGQKGARISVSLDHQKQINQHDNVRLLRKLVNGASLNDLRRELADPDTGKKCGVSRLYSRIFWLEKTLLAFEKAKLKEWKEREEKSDRFKHMQIAHDDVVVSVNWESKTDKRLTPLQFSVSADIRTGYVFRIDANFDPRVDPTAFFQENYLTQNGQLKNIRGHYQQKSGRSFTAPLLHFQRPSGRFDEAALFASTENEWRVFSERVMADFEPDEDGVVPPIPDNIQQHLDKAEDQRCLLNELRHGYFGLPESHRDYRGGFNGIMVRPTYTKAAHLACIKEMMPHGKITLVGEQEASMVRVVPHIFRDMIQEDLFEWFVLSFDKTSSKPVSKQREDDFQEDLEIFKQAWRRAHPDEISDYELLRLYCAQKMKPAMKKAGSGVKPFPIVNFQSEQFPALWIRSPVQHYGETNKVVGFPLLRKEYRKKLKGIAFHQDIQDQELREALARRVLASTIQPVSSFMNSLRVRTSPTERAGGNSTRTGPSYISGAMFNPAVLVAILNIYRVYFNWFEPRQYVSGASGSKGKENVSEGHVSIRVPGTKEYLKKKKRRNSAPILSTPAVRLGADKRSKGADMEKAPDPRRVLYRPWLFHGTPLWRRFETR